MSDSNKNRLFFKNLDSIRFIAAFMVYLGHGVSPAYKFLSIEGTFWERLLNTVSNGGTGVSIFFVLSGFLITYLLISEHELT
ncbi:MAG: acyltransferase family protein [Chitinophagaceae bacterium]|nr:acyltransferase family protein [Chitinophagaceae bacterium]